MDSIEINTDGSIDSQTMVLMGLEPKALKVTGAALPAAVNEINNPFAMVLSMAFMLGGYIGKIEKHSKNKSIMAQARVNMQAGYESAFVHVGKANDVR